MTNAVTIAQYGSVSPNKNRIINGAMTFDQRNNGASVSTPTAGAWTYFLDRWAYFGSSSGKYSVQQNAGAVTPPTGFTNYLGVTSLAATTVGASDVYDIKQAIEGFNTADLGFGTANAQPITLSFWVRSSLTGAFGGSLSNDAFNRLYPFSYTISVANTWEYKTITIPGDTTGTWLTNNAIGVNVVFGLGVGSTFQGTANVWGSSGIVPTGSTSVVSTSGATFYITGVQLEEGTAASPFENRLYGTELALCQRYYQVSTSGIGWANTSTNTTVMTSFFCAMRTAPTVSLFNGTNTFLDSGIAQRNITGIISIDSSTANPSLGSKMDINTSSTTASKTALTFAGAFAFSAEL
jgi:hypothetical protein